MSNIIKFQFPDPYYNNNIDANSQTPNTSPEIMCNKLTFEQIRTKFTNVGEVRYYIILYT